jgi:hypothetical protein
MIDKKQLSILIVMGILIFLAGGALGIISENQKIPTQKIETANNLSSKVISSIVAYGEVKSVNGRNIVLSNLGTDLTIRIAENAPVYSFATRSGSAAPVQQTVKLSDISKGDKINIALKVLPIGQMEGTSVVILESPSK